MSSEHGTRKISTRHLKNLFLGHGVWLLLVQGGIFWWQ